MLKKTLLKWITHSATVTHVSDPARNFRSLTLHSGRIQKSNVDSRR